MPATVCGSSVLLNRITASIAGYSPPCTPALTNNTGPGVAPVEWGIEMDNPLGLSRNGWKPGSLKPGDQVVVVAHPLRDGTNGAQVVSVNKDGKLIGKAAAAPVSQ